MKKILSIFAVCTAFTLFAPFAILSLQKEFSDSTPENELITQLPDSADGDTPDENDGNLSDSVGGDSATENDTPVATPTVQTAKYVRCTGNGVNLRAGAGTDYAVLGSAEKDTVYAVLGKTGSWYKTYYRGQIAYLYAEYASVFTLQKSADEQTETVLLEGYKLIGTPYVYGAVRLHDGYGNLLGNFNAQKFDCSSLVQYIFYKGAGKLLNTTTRTQSTQGKYVHPDNLQRGDCIYFTNAEREHKTGVERIGHVAVYLGNNYILHTASDYARIEKMSATRWNYYIEARRFL